MSASSAAAANVRRMPDTRRVCDLNPCELLDAAFRAFAAFGWTRGRWRVEVHLDEGLVRKIVSPTPLDALPARATVGRRQLEQPVGPEAT